MAAGIIAMLAIWKVVAEERREIRHMINAERNSSDLSLIR